MRVSKWMTENPVCVRPDDLLQVVADAMQRGRFRHTPVIAGDGRVIGMVSERELREQTGYWSSSRVTAALSEPAITVRVDALMIDAARILLERQISALPVVDSEQHILGIVTTTDVLRAFIESAAATDATPRHE